MERRGEEAGSVVGGARREPRGGRLRRGGEWNSRCKCCAVWQACVGCARAGPEAPAAARPRQLFASPSRRASAHGSWHMSACPSVRCTRPFINSGAQCQCYCPRKGMRQRRQDAQTAARASAHAARQNAPCGKADRRQRSGTENMSARGRGAMASGGGQRGIGRTGMQAAGGSSGASSGEGAVQWGSNGKSCHER